MQLRVRAAEKGVLEEFTRTRMMHVEIENH